MEMLVSIAMRMVIKVVGMAAAGRGGRRRGGDKDEGGGSEE
jgi:hypothetical protein